jgi:hypothetical protein
MVTNLCIPQNVGNFLLAEELLAYQEGLCFMELLVAVLRFVVSRICNVMQWSACVVGDLSTAGDTYLLHGAESFLRS